MSSTPAPSTLRGKAMREQREKDGYVRLQDWINPEAVAAIDELLAKNPGKKRAQIIEMAVLALNQAKG